MSTRNVNRPWWHLPLRLVRDIFFTIVCVLVVLAALVALRVVLIALPIFVGFWLFFWLLYWLASRVPMWMDLDRFNLCRQHRWPLAGNVFFFVVTSFVTWWLIRPKADAIASGYYETLIALPGIGRALQIYEDAAGWLVDAAAAVLGRVGQVTGLSGLLDTIVVAPMSWLSAALVPWWQKASNLSCVDGLIRVFGMSRACWQPATLTWPGSYILLLLVIAVASLFAKVTADARRLCMIEEP
ncbi:MAG: hypothetical protein ABWY00_16820 [Dongiaceae bacterium]